MFKSKVYRLFCFLFAFSLVFALFGVEASAASDNLINPDLTTWTDVSGSVDGAFPVTVKKYGSKYFRVQLSDTDYSVYMGAILDNTSLVAGHSYSLSFNLPDVTEINSALGTSFSSTSFDWNFENTSLTIGIGFISSSGEIDMYDNTTLYRIESNNYSKYLGKELKSSFVASNYSGTPCVMIVITSLDGQGHYFYFSDFKLVDNDDNSAELTGIKGFLHSIRWDLVGGTCEEEDCPHSSGDNPHLSLSERMSSGFATMFQSIGDKFEEGSTLNLWFNGLSDKVGSINVSLSGLGDRISGFFSGLGDRISGFFSNLGDRMSGFFTNLGNSIGGFFSDLKTNMSNWFSELGNKITTKFQEIGDKFTEFFDKFKPRVAVNLKWQRGNIDVDTGEIIDYVLRVVTSDLFTVNGDTCYYVTYSPLIISNATHAAIYQYDLKGNYVGRILYDKNSFDAFSLPAGYQYRFSVYWLKGWELDDSAVNEVFTVYAEEGWLNAVLLNMKIGVKDLFVPDEAFIVTWKEEMDGELESHLGFLYQIPDFIISYVEVIRNTLKDNDRIEFTFPKIEFEFNGEKIHLWDAIKVDFSFLEKEPFSTIYSIYKVGICIIFGSALVMYGKHVWEKVMSN